MVMGFFCCCCFFYNFHPSLFILQADCGCHKHKHSSLLKDAHRCTEIKADPSSSENYIFIIHKITSIKIGGIYNTQANSPYVLKSIAFQQCCSAGVEHMIKCNKLKNNNKVKIKFNVNS